MPEVIHSTGLHALRYGNALGNCHDDCLMLCHLLFHIPQELFLREMGLRHVDQMGCRIAIGVEHGAGSRQPAGVSAHDLHDGDGGHAVD